ncbi:MAG: hypothetical protein JWO05_3306 [Gemmatimonadetes bacterium]|nr:hypothetical protein [Gemmatimonadota bacterium]
MSESRASDSRASDSRMSDARVSYNFAVLRVVPHPYLGAFVPVGVVVHARTSEFLKLKAVHDVSALRGLVGPDTDVETLAKYIACLEQICDGDVGAGDVALLPPSERFHWLTAPRSDVLQSSPVHGGMTADPGAALERLFGQYVGAIASS